MLEKNFHSFFVSHSITVWFKLNIHIPSMMIIIQPQRGFTSTFRETKVFSRILMMEEKVIAALVTRDSFPSKYRTRFIIIAIKRHWCIDLERFYIFGIFLRSFARSIRTYIHSQRCFFSFAFQLFIVNYSRESKQSSTNSSTELLLGIVAFISQLNVVCNVEIWFFNCFRIIGLGNVEISFTIDRFIEMLVFVRAYL